MKKIAILFGATILSYAASNEQIVSYFKDRIDRNDVTIEVKKREKSGVEGIESVKLLVKGEGGEQVLHVFTKDNLIFPDIIDIKSKKSYLQEAENKELLTSIGKEIAKEDKNNFVYLGNDKNKETLIVFTDPECPYCKKKIDTIEDGLKTYNFKIIFTPVHELTSFQKSAIIYKKTKDAKTDEQKIKILKQYFEPEVKVDENVDEAEILKIQLLKEKYFALGMQGVPFIVSEKELAKYKN